MGECMVLVVKPEEGNSSFTFKVVDCLLVTVTSCSQKTFLQSSGDRVQVDFKLRLPEWGLDVGEWAQWCGFTA